MPKNVFLHQNMTLLAFDKTTNHHVVTIWQPISSSNVMASSVRIGKTGKLTIFGIRTTAHTHVSDNKALSGSSGLLNPCLAISKSAANYNTPGYFSHKKNASYQTHISKACSSVIDGLHPYLSTSPCTSLLPLWDISREEATSEARPAFRAYR